MCLAKNDTALATVVDHIKPLALGGSDDDENTRNLCDEHHAQVTAEQFDHRETVAVGSDGWPALAGRHAKAPHATGGQKF